MREGPFHSCAQPIGAGPRQFWKFPELADAPEILAIGDTHIENFGTWRDVEGRLIWGANDFDEAAFMPYPLDLVRPATSALLGRGDDGPTASVICAALLEGYTQGLAAPAPLVLERDYKWLRKAVMLSEPDRAAFRSDTRMPCALACLIRLRPW